ncbi:MAG: sigma-70 family RNA polymerase sigma factor [Elusimicrobiota bacterium]
MSHTTAAVEKNNIEKTGNPTRSLSTQELERCWSEYVKSRSPQLKETLLARYSYLVRYVLGRMKVSLVPNLDHDDLESAGIICLIQTLDRFDPSRGIKFETYAYQRIQGGILDYLRKMDFLSRSSRDRIKKFKVVLEKLTEKLGKTPSDDELMVAMKLDADGLKQVYFEMSCESPVSLESTGDFSDASEGTWNNDGGIDLNEPEVFDQLIKKETAEILGQVIDSLPERDRNLISLYYYENLTFKEIGTILKVSESRICQMHSKALLDIESGLKKKGLR